VLAQFRHDDVELPATPKVAVELRNRAFGIVVIERDECEPAGSSVRLKMSFTLLTTPTVSNNARKSSSEAS